MNQHARRRRQLLLVFLDIALGCTVLAMLAGGWFAFMAWKHATQMSGMVAVVFVLGAPALAVAVILARQEARCWDEQTPMGELIDAVYRTEAALRFVRLVRAHVGVVSSYVVVMWVCEAGGMVRLKEFLVFFTFACTVTAVAYLPGLAARERLLRDECAELQQRLREIDAGWRKLRA